MTNVFEIADKTGRKIHLTKERWRHISKEHPEIHDFEEIKEALATPLVIKPSRYDPTSVRYYYRFNKKRKNT